MTPACSSRGQSCTTLGMVPALGALGWLWAVTFMLRLEPTGQHPGTSQHPWVTPAAAGGSWRWPGVLQGWMRGLYMSESASSPGCCSCS